MHNSYNAFLSEWLSDDPCVEVRTSGSTGEPKVMRVEKRRMEASARNTLRALALHEGDSALLCLPLDFIAGKMMVVRALVGGLRLMVVEASGNPLRGLHEVPDFAAMIPMQVYNSLQTAEERDILRRIPCLIIGGSGIDDALEAELRTFPNAIYSTYGMTETLSHCALRRISMPARQGVSGTEPTPPSPYYHPLPGVSVSLDDNHCLVVDAPDICHAPLTTNDIAELSPDGRSFRIIGRRDNVICCGGIKIHIEEVERMLKPHLPMPFLITRCKDRKFGEVVVMVVERNTVERNTVERNTMERNNRQRGMIIGDIETLCRDILPKYYRPRHIVEVDELPLTANGKPARKAAERLVDERLSIIGQ